jgi:NADH:ubiquinone oxidoreductase subunit C
MVLSSSIIINLLPTVRVDAHFDERSFLVSHKDLKNILFILKNCFLTQYKILTCVSGVDYPKNSYRFSVVYEVLSLKYNSRLRLKTLVNEITPINSIESVFIGAGWWESELWDMFGVFVIKPYSLTRLLTDYGFKGHPLRKDFPLSGFLETRYNSVKNKVLYENVELAQEHRVMSYLHPWGDMNE